MRFLLAGLFMLFGIFNAGRAGAADAPLSGAATGDAPIVLELFTSQSCSSCPPADALLSRLAAQPNVIALGCHVTYWDHLSWRDTFSHSFCTDRQRAYASAAGRGSLFTPELVVNGADSAVGSRESEVSALLARPSARPLPIGISQTASGEFLLTLPQTGPQTGRKEIVQIIAYGDGKTQAIESGENAGRQVHYVNPVLAIIPIGRSELGAATPLTFDPRQLPAGAQGFAVLVQKVSAVGIGPITAAGVWKIKPQNKS